jgi:hypothetical protein
MTITRQSTNDWLNYEIHDFQNFYNLLSNGRTEIGRLGKSDIVIKGSDKKYIYLDYEVILMKLHNLILDTSSNLNDSERLSGKALTTLLQDFNKKLKEQAAKIIFFLGVFSNHLL